MTGIEQVGWGPSDFVPLVTLDNIIKVIAMLKVMLWTLWGQNELQKSQLPFIERNA